MTVITHDQAVDILRVKRKPSVRAKAISRAALILRILSTYGNNGASLAQVCEASGLHKATAHRLLTALANERLVERAPASRNYRLGPDVFAFGATIGERFDFKKLVRPSLEYLAGELSDTSYLGIQSGYDGLCLDCCEGAFERKTLTLRILDRWPLGVGAFTMAILAFLNDDEVTDIIEHNHWRLAERPLYAPSRLWKIVSETRSQGFALNEVKAYPGMTGIAAPILDHKHRPIASLGVAAINERLLPPRRQSVAMMLKAECKKVADLYHSLNRPDMHGESWKRIGEPFPFEVKS